jgi:hypothetical protein
MNWYLAKIVYRIICGDGHHTAQFDEQLRLVSAQHEEDALDKAAAIGIQEEEVFYNDKQQLVHWKFTGIAELHALNKLTDGAEVFSQIKETGDPEAYSSFVLHKAKILREKYSQKHLQTA